VPLASPAAVTAPEAEVMTPPCSIHDDRLLELETEQASHTAQLRAGSEMFHSLQESIGTLSRQVSLSMDRIEGKVDRLSNTVGDIRVELGRHGVQIVALTEKEAKEERVLEERKKTAFEYAVKIGGTLVILTLASVAGAHGREWLAALLRAVAG
jgi:hypothetical protein